MRIGLIFCGYNCEDSVLDCLKPWIEIKNSTQEHTFVYSCVSVPFDKYNCNPPDQTVNIIKSLNVMDYVFTDSKHISEIEARGLGLQFLKDSNCDIIWQVDISDEFYTVQEIQNITKYVEDNKSIAWFKLCLKNYCFNDKTYLAEPFTPARIYRINFAPYVLGTFREDNNLTYIYKNLNAEVPDLFVKHKIIPQSCAWIKHLTWISNERSKEKISYQKSRWGKCSFQWNDYTNHLEFNPDYYKGKFPDIIKEL